MKKTATRANIVEALRIEAGMQKKDAEQALNIVMGTIIRLNKKGFNVQLRAFGTFQVKKRKAKMVNLPTCTARIPDQIVVKFKPHYNID